MDDEILESSIVSGARYICQYAHGTQMYAWDVPYWKHPEAVAAKMDTDQEKIVAYLHDVLEDTSYPADQILRLFGREILDLVLIITRKKEERYREYIRRVKANPITRKVKMADIEHNMNNLANLEDERAEKLRKRYTAALIVLTTE